MAIRPRLAARREGDAWAFRLAVVLLVVLAAWPLWYALRYTYGVVPFGGVDFKAYYLTGLRVRHGLPLYGDALTQAVSKPRATRFLYPPVVALPFVALTVTSPGVARIVFLAVQFGFLWGSILVLLAAWGVPLTRWRAVAVGWLLAGVQPVFFLLRIGNVTGFLAGLLCLSAAVTVSPRGPSRPFLGGVLAALAGVPKPYVAPAGAHLLGHRRRLLGAGLVVFLLGVVSIVLFGPETTGTYLDLLRPEHAWRGSRPPAPLPRHYRPFAWFHQVPPLRPAIQAGLLLTAVALVVLGASDEQALVFALGCVTVPLVAPTADTLTLVVAIPGLLVAGLSEARRGGNPSIVLGSGLAIFLSVYTVRLVRDYGPTSAPALPWAAVRSLLVLQPATGGLLGVFGLCLVRICTAREEDDGLGVNAVNLPLGRIRRTVTRRLTELDG